MGIDERVAIEVMGYKAARDYCVNGIPIADFHPSKRIEQAWMVVEKMKVIHPDWQFELGDNHHEGKWYALFELPMTDHQYYGFADTAPMAICRAALKAKETK